jgi:predicted Zn-dependent peptidase
LWEVPEHYKKLDAAMVRQAAQTYLKTDNYVKVTLLPEAK